MEDELRTHLICVADLYAAAGGKRSESTICNRVLRNDGFLENLRSGERGFNIRKYDQLMEWYSDNWPEGTEWPAGVPNPADKVLALPASETVAAVSDTSPGEVRHG